MQNSKLNHKKIYLFHRLTCTPYLCNECLPWYNVVLTSRVQSSVKCSQQSQLRTRATVKSVLNHCLSWSKFVKIYLSHSSQWFNIYWSNISFDLNTENKYLLPLLRSASSHNQREPPGYRHIPVSLLQQRRPWTGPCVPHPGSRTATTRLLQSSAREDGWLVGLFNVPRNT